MFSFQTQLYFLILHVVFMLHFSFSEDMRTKLKGTSHLLLLIPALLLTAACASMGTPTGGPRDEEPPRFVRSNPAPGATNVKRNHISLEFNELVNVKDAFQNVVVSPTGSSTPRVQ